MNFSLADLAPLLPEIFLLAMLSIILVVDAALKDSQRVITYVLTMLTLAGCAWLTLKGLNTEPVFAMSGMFVDDAMADVLKMALYLAVAFMLVYSREYLKVRGLYKGEFYVLTLFSTLGMMVMISASHFLTLYLGLELLSLSLYAMVALNRDSAASVEAAMKYFAGRDCLRHVAVRHVDGLRQYRLVDAVGCLGCAARRHRSENPADVWRGVHRRRSGFQARRSAVPHVGAGRVPGCDHACYPVY